MRDDRLFSVKCFTLKKIKMAFTIYFSMHAAIRS
jgi:hypothetical protein